MKKVLSMVLALALVLTTLVVPMTVSAAGETFTISYKLLNGEAEADTIYPGDDITVEVYANASSEVATNGYELFIPFPTGMTFKETDGTNNIDIDGTIKFSYGDNANAVTIKTAEDGGTKIGCFTFTVPANATGNYSIAAIGANTDSLIADADFNDVVPTAEAKSFAVSAHAAEVQVKYGEMSDFAVDEDASIETASAGEVYVKVVATTPTEISDVKIAKSENGEYGEATDVTEGNAAFSAYGTYKITYKTVDDDKTHEYVITYKSSVVADLVATASATSVEAGGAFTVNVSVDQLSENLVEVLTFDVEYDSTYLTLDTTTKQTDVEFGEDGAVTYRASGTGVAEDVTVVALKFTANSAYVGTQSVTIKNQKLAVDAGFDPSESRLDQESADIVKVTVYSADAVTVPEIADEVNYAKARDIAVSQTTDWTVDDGQLSVAYKSYAVAQTETTPESIYTTGTTLTLPGTITAATEDYYYVVARYGAEGSYVYVQLAEYTPKQLRLDLDAPEIAMTTDFTNWTKEATVDFTVTDAKAGVKSMSYKLSSEATGWEEAIAGENGAYTIELPEDTVVTSIIVKAADMLDNESTEKTLNVQYDAVAPVIAVEAGDYTDAGIPITVTLTPATSGSEEPESVSVTKKDSTEAAETVDFVKGDVATTATYTATSDGVYVFTVKDKAGNTTTVESGEIEVGKKSVLKAPTFKISKAESAVAGSLKTDAELDSLYGEEFDATNGSFTYLQVIAADDATGEDKEGNDYTTTYTLTKDGVAVAEWTPNAAIVASTGIQKYVLTVKTAMDDNVADYQEASYTFHIADRASFKTVNGDNKYRVTDYLIMGLMLTDGASFKDDVSAKYTGGYFSGDVTADLADNDWNADRTEMLNKIKAAGNWRTYDYAIYNGLEYTEASAE